MRMNPASLIYRDFYEVGDAFVGEVSSMVECKQTGHPPEYFSLKLSRKAGESFKAEVLIGFGSNTLSATRYGNTLLDCRHNIEQTVESWIKEVSP